MKKYIKLNNNDNHLSLGNFTRIIKENTINKTSALQTEVFSTLFNTANINDTTINNYCIGIRSINNDYKQQYIIYKKNYPKDNYILLDIIINLLTKKKIATVHSILYISCTVRELLIEACINFITSDESK